MPDTASNLIGCDFNMLVLAFLFNLLLEEEKHTPEKILPEVPLWDKE